MVQANQPRNCWTHNAIPFYPSTPGLEGDRAGGGLPDFAECISRWTTGRIFSIRSSMVKSRPEVVQCNGHLPICPVWAKNFKSDASGSRLCGTHIFESTGQIYFILSSMELSRAVVVQWHSNLPICLMWAYLIAHGSKTCQIRYHWGPDIAEHISLKLLDGITRFEIVWKCLNI